MQRTKGRAIEADDSEPLDGAAFTGQDHLMESRVRAGARATFAIYAAMIAATIAAVFGIGKVGARIVAPPPGAGAAAFGQGAPSVHASVLAHVLIALVVVIVAARAL